MSRTYSEMELNIALVLAQLAIVAGIPSFLLGFLWILDTVDWPAVLFAGMGWGLGWFWFFLLTLFAYSHVYENSPLGGAR